MALEVGSVVKLKAKGSIEMTVWRVIGEDLSSAAIKMQDQAYKMAGYKEGDVICQWFEGTKIHSGAFRIEMLEIVSN